MSPFVATLSLGFLSLPMQASVVQLEGPWTPVAVALLSAGLVGMGLSDWIWGGSTEPGDLDDEPADDVDDLFGGGGDDVLDLHEFDASFASALLSNPDRLLRRGSAVLRDLEDGLDRVNVRLTNHPGLLPIGRLRTRHAGEIVTVEGTIATVGEVQARIDLARFECAACGATATTRTTGRRLPDPLRCEECGAHGTMSLRPGRSRYVDVQRVTIEGAGPDDAPRGLEAFLDDDLVDAVRPGEEVVLTGVLRLAATGEPNRFDFYLDGITVEESRPVDPGAGGDAADDIQSLIRERWQFAVDR